jgi:glycosyltransferase involved in cell wall biosynthesis
MPYRLSLCIPTLNRAAYIGEALDSMSSQATDEVEIVVVDGGSTDGTGDIVRDRQRRWPRLRYLRREQDLGVERDTDKAVELAKGEYCWLMTSDDVLKPGAIGAVLDVIRQGHQLIVVNAEVRDIRLRKLLEPSKLRPIANRVYAPGECERLFVDVAEYLSYMGGVVIRKDLWEARDRTGYLDTDFVHVGVIFQAPLPGTAIVITEPLISIRYGNATWTPRQFEVWGINWPTVLWSFRNISESAKRRIFGQEGWRNFRRLLVQRAAGAYSLEEYRHWIRPADGTRGSKLAAWLIAVLPGGPLNLLMVCYFSLRGRRGGNLIELKQSRYFWLKRAASRCM